MKAYSQDLRDIAITMHKAGCTAKKISQTLLIHYETSKSWIKYYKKTGICNSRQHLNKGVNRKFTDKQAVLDYLEEHPNALALEMRDALAPELAMSTFRNTLQWMKITYKKKNRHMLNVMNSNVKSI